MHELRGQQALSARRRKLIAGAAILLGIAALLAWRVRGGERAAATGAAKVAESPHALRVPARARPAIASGPAGLARDPDRKAGLWMLADPTLPRNAADYLVANRFPPQSRPLHTGQVDLLEPNRRYEQERGVQHRDGTLSDEAYRYLFTGDRFLLIGDDAATAVLQVWRDGELVAVDVTAARVVARHAPELATEVAFQAHDGPIYAAAIQPARAPFADHEGFLELQIEFDYGGPAPGYAELDFRYQPAARAPARFTGTFREALEDGSLVIYAGVEVEQPGYYVMDLNLFDAADQPFAWTRYKGELPAGAAEARFVVYGRLFHESGAPQPLTARNLRGYLVIDVDPGERHLAPYPGEHRTQSYELDQLTADEYWNERKEEYVRMQIANIDREGIPKQPSIGDSGWQPDWKR